MHRLPWGLVLILVALLGCARAVHPRLPEGEEYVFPSSGPGEVRGDEARRIEAAWRDVLAGHVATAERGFQKLLSRHPGLVAAETGLAYARLRGGWPQDAIHGFDVVLARRPDYVPALVGAASAAARSGDAEAALALYRRAQIASPRDAVVQKRLAEVKLQVTERGVAGGRAALAAGETERAIEQYRHALDAAPELGSLRIELADLLAGRGDLKGATDVLLADPGQDRQVLLRLGEVLAARQEFGRALEAYRWLLARDPRDPEALRRAAEARQGLELQQMPEEYRRIFSSPRLTRADVAALVSAKVTGLARVPPGEPKVAVDISGSWAREHIIKVLALDIMEVYPNHTFQPGAIARRGDLARALARVLDLLKWPASPGPVLKDMSANNLFREAAVRVVAAGLMDTTPDGAFEPWRPIAGRDAVAVIEALVRLVGP